MLTDLYIDALLVDENLADQVWELWDADVIDCELAAIAWLLLPEFYFLFAWLRSVAPR